MIIKKHKEKSDSEENEELESSSAGKFSISGT
jgi:hypothetical protein